MLDIWQHYQFGIVRDVEKERSERLIRGVKNIVPGIAQLKSPRKHRPDLEITISRTLAGRFARFAQRGFITITRAGVFVPYGAGIKEILICAAEPAETRTKNQ